MESANKLERLVNEKYEGLHLSKSASTILHVLLELAQVIQAYDTVIVRTMKLNLHPQWEEAIDTFVAAYNTFATSFTKLFPRYRSDELMTPKIAYIQYEVKRWIKKFDVSLLRIVEQAFEGVHYVFLAKEKHYSIPRTGAELLAGERRFTSDPSFDRKTKGRIVIQATKKRKASSKNDASVPSESTSDVPQRRTAKKSNEHDVSDSSAQDIQLARKLLVRAVAAFNAQNILRCGDGCYERMQEMLEYIQSGKNKKNAPWKFNKKKSKPKKKDIDELWEM